LREAGRRVGFDYRSRSVGRQFKVANQARADRAIVVGPEEVESGQYVVRTLSTGEERRLGLAELVPNEDGS
jgi:histidyl-tRNA synthetase